MRHSVVLLAVLAVAGPGPRTAEATWRGTYVASAEDVALPPPPGAFIGGFAFDRAGHPVVFNGEAVVRRQGEVWEELYRGPGARGVPGSGLGLTLARAIVERHDGQITLRSRVGQGTVVTMRLPAQ